MQHYLSKDFPMFSLIALFIARRRNAA